MADRAAPGRPTSNVIPQNADGEVLGSTSAPIKAEIVITGLTATVSEETPVITVDKIRQQEEHILSNVGTAIHAQFAAGAALNASSGFTNPGVPRCVQIARGGAGNVTVYTVTGTDITGAALVETINSNGASTVQGTRAFLTITAFSSDVDPGVTTDLQTGKGFGLAAPFSDLDRLAVDDTIEAAASSHATTGTVVPTTAPNGTRRFVIRYRVLPTATQAAHTHEQELPA